MKRMILIGGVPHSATLKQREDGRWVASALGATRAGDTIEEACDALRGGDS